jgi:hypothetical protein
MPAPHPVEFRQRAVELARTGDKPVAALAKDLGISESCLRNWMAQADADDGGADAENLIRAAHAARSYSWRRPPRRSFRWMRRRVIAAGSVIGSGSGRIGRAFAIPR